MRTVTRVPLLTALTLVTLVPSSARAETVVIRPVNLDGVALANVRITIRNAENNQPITPPPLVGGAFTININRATARAIRVQLLADDSVPGIVQSLLVADQDVTIALPLLTDVPPEAPPLCCEPPYCGRGKRLFFWRR